MAYNPGSQHYQPSSNRPAPPVPPRRYGSSASAHAGQPQYVQRTPSFDAGDDTRYPPEAGKQEERPYGNRQYRANSNAGIQNEELFMGVTSPTYPARSTSYGTSTGGYQHQGLPPAPPSSQPSYNPQSYGMSPQPSLSSPTSSSFSSAHQPYIPAAYHQTPPQSAIGGQSYPPQALTQAQPYQPSGQPLPPLPPRTNGQNYGFRTSPQTESAHAFHPRQGSYRQSATSSQASSSPITSRPGYTPPVPPPPPFSPARDAFPSNSPSETQQQSLSHRSSISHNSPQTTQHSSPLNYASRHSNSNSAFSPHIDLSQNLSPTLASNNSLPPTPGTPGPTPPAHSPQRTNTTGRHPQARPLPGPPSASATQSYFPGRNGYLHDEYIDEEEPGYDENDDLMKEVEDAVMGRQPSNNSRHSRGVETGNEESPIHGPGSLSEIIPDTSHSHTNGDLGNMGSNVYVNYDAYSDRSDAEAEAGLAAMHMADEQDANEEAWRHGRESSYSRSQGSQQELRQIDQAVSSDSDVPIDMDTYGGGFSGRVSYGARPMSGSLRRSDLSSEALEMHKSLYDYPPLDDEIHPFPPTISARVDTGGTGGLSEPGSHPRRLSFEDGDETTLADSEAMYASSNQSPSRESMPDMSFYPEVTNRPLPAAPVGSLSAGRIPQLMPAGAYQNQERFQQYDQSSRPSYPLVPDAFNQSLTPSGTPVPRSSSLISHPSNPQTVPPIRAKTDADRARILKQQQMMGMRGTSVYGSEYTPDSSLAQSAELLNLPEIPAGKRRKFNPSKLSSHDFKKCERPWALSSIAAWIKEMSDGETDLKEFAIAEGIVALFTHKVPTMNIADAEALGARVVRSMFDAGTLAKDEEWVKFTTEPVSGVLFQLTGTGCYSPRSHTQTLPGRCYSHHCMRTLKKINLQAQSPETQHKQEDWATFYKLTKEKVENADKKEIERQNNLHEIVTKEDTFIDQLDVLRLLYRDGLDKVKPPIISPKKRETFISQVFGKVDAVKQVNEDHLLAQLKYRQQEQGPWIVGFSDIFRQWIRKARNAYIEYAAGFPNATFLIRHEAERNILFKQFLDQVREDPRSGRLGWDSFLKAPITQIQRYSLQLSTVLKHQPHDSEEKRNLQLALDEIKAATFECDARVAEMSKHVELSELASKLVLRPEMSKVKLNLTHLGREIIFKGDLQTTGQNKFTWLERHVILFDHYLVLAKTVSQRDAAGGLKYEKYDVSKLVRCSSGKIQAPTTDFEHSQYQWIF